jgi:hypothetical protein
MGGEVGLPRLRLQQRTGLQKDFEIKCTVENVHGVQLLADVCFL